MKSSVDNLKTPKFDINHKKFSIPLSSNKRCCKIKNTSMQAVVDAFFHIYRFGLTYPWKEKEKKLPHNTQYSK